MKRICFAAAAAVTLAAPAMAADLAAYAKAPVPAPAYGWSSFYVGLNAGTAWRNSDPAVTYIGDLATGTTSAALPSLRGSGFTGGAQAGYNWQRGRWVLGGEVDFNWLGGNSGARVEPFWVNSLAPNNLVISSRYDWLATARLRAGVLVTPDLLLYATGGLAVTSVNNSATFSFPTFPSTIVWSERRTLFGAAIGGGLEYAFAPNWAVKAEYLHAAFNNVNPQWTSPGVVAGSYVSFAHNLNLFRLGLNYRWDAPQSMEANARMLPARAAPVVNTARWSGVYAGVHAGYAWGDSDPFATADTQHGEDENLATLPRLPLKGGLGGAQLGYNWQVGALVVGGEVDVSALSAKGDSTVSPLYIEVGDRGTFSSTYHWLATARLRAGVAPVADLLLYATGGLAVARVTDSLVHSNIPPAFSPDPTVTRAATTTLFGGAIGGGLEYAFAPNWSFKAEYLYAVFSKTAPRTSVVGFAPPNVGFDHSLHMVRAGVNYQFGG